MKLTAVILARVFVPLIADELNPRGRALTPEVISGFIQKLGFVKYPKIEDLFNLTDEGKGVVFGHGAWGETAIDQMMFYPSGIAVDTRASTDVSEVIIKEVLSWLTEQIGVVFRQDTIKRRFYASQVNFVSEMSLTALNPRFKEFGERITKNLAGNIGQTLHVEPYSVSFNFEPLTSKLNIPQFRIERVEDVPFSENRYFSAAPLPTDDHLRLLEDFEAALIEAAK